METPGCDNHRHAQVIKFMTEVSEERRNFTISSLGEFYYTINFIHSTIQKVSGKLVADIRPIVTRRGVNIIHTTTITTPCDNLRPSTLCLSKDDTIIKEINSFRPITDKVI